MKCDDICQRYSPRILDLPLKQTPGVVFRIWWMFSNRRKGSNHRIPTCVNNNVPMKLFVLAQPWWKGWTSNITWWARKRWSSPVMSRWPRLVDADARKQTCSCTATLWTSSRMCMYTCGRGQEWKAGISSCLQFEAVKCFCGTAMNLETQTVDEATEDAGELHAQGWLQLRNSRLMSNTRYLQFSSLTHQMFLCFIIRHPVWLVQNKTLQWWNLKQQFYISAYHPAPGFHA